MIQRIQTIYLLLSFMTVGILPFVFPLWKTFDGKSYFFMQNQVYAIIFGICTTLSILAILFYQKRQHQFVIGRLNILLNLILLGLFVYKSLNIESKTVSEKGVGMFLPILAVIFLVLANKAIKKDEDLLKSIDRVR